MRCAECSGRGWLLCEGRLRMDCDQCNGSGEELADVA